MVGGATWAIIILSISHMKPSSPRAPATALAPLALDTGALRSTLHLISTRAALAIPRVSAVADLLAAELIAAGKASGATARARRR